MLAVLCLNRAADQGRTLFSENVSVQNSVSLPFSPTCPSPHPGSDTWTRIHSCFVAFTQSANTYVRTTKKGKAWTQLSRSLILNLILKSEQTDVKGGE